MRGLGENRPVGFVKDVMPVLGKAGCNSGACHGGAKGKNGFKLSLRGYDPAFDYAALVNDLAGRRFNRADPAQSLMLLKPTMAVAHGGGQRLAPGSRYYETVLAWIREGVQFNDAAAGVVSSLDVAPREIFMTKPGLAQQMLVTARYPDGSERDVTAESSFVSTNPSMAEVNDSGLVKLVRKGEATIQVRYQGQYLQVGCTALPEKAGFAWSAPVEHNYIDRFVDRKLERLHILPSPPASDGEFMRRVSLDLTGQVPRTEEVRAFLNDPTESRIKRSRLVERLLASPEYADHWALKWGDLLLSNRRFLGEKGLWAYRSWIRQSIAANKPYDQFVREIVTASGSTYSNPSANFLRATREPKAMMETISQVFLGVRMMCANCHDHPFESWTQRNYYEMMAFFNGVSMKEGPAGDEEIVYETRSDTPVRHPKYGYVVTAGFPFARPAHFDAEHNRREQFAEWLTSKDNPYFATAIANRTWSYFFGRGIFDPVDDLRPSNPPSNRALLEALANDVRQSNFDLKQLMRRIAGSRVYQSSYRANEWNLDDETNFSHQRPRRLTAEQLLDAVARATGSRVKFEGMPEGFRAEQLPDSKVGMGGFLDLFGRPARESSCECERRGDISLAQALNLVNGSVLGNAIADPDGRVAKLLLAGATDGKIVEELYLATLSRLPDAGESRLALEYLKGGKNRAERAQDLLWALLNSHAFLFNS
ncbi:MAG: hypothetical protein DMG07_16125 [Acidobacteria bacterium]|nr:MAG: hypothetical protein DMG07_16125 [Acidobacteriota bacterium]